jgi:phosphatidylglycerophosphate synthase
MAKQDATTLLVDSAPTRDCSRLWKNGGQSPVLLEESSSPPRSESFRGAAALIEREWLARQEKAVGLFAQLFSDATVGRIDVCDAALHETYVVALRKHVRPVFFPAPSRDLTAVAERFPRDVAQNGVLDIPGFLDSPIEDWIVARLCRTSITPNQVTLITMLIGLGVTVLFLTGHLWWGAALAYTIEVLDGVDGKLARTKIETTATGEWEHVVDYCVELSWWTALAYHFHGHGVPSAYWLLLLLFGSDLIDRLAKRVVKKKVGRNLDDVAGFDRFVRWIGSRRNINIWILIIALILGGAAHGFVFFCWWGAITAAAHVVRAFQIRLALPPGRDTGAAW